MHKVQQWWLGAVEAAGRADQTAGRLERLQHWAVRVAAEAIAEQRTLWSLRHGVPASLLHPADLTGSAAAELRDRLLTAAGRRHGRWLGVYGLAFVASGLVMIIPGPNLLAYYFAVRFVGHYLSWRGARCALDTTTWDARAEPALGELAGLASAEPAARAPRVEAIARGLESAAVAGVFRARGHARSLRIGVLYSRIFAPPTRRGVRPDQHTLEASRTSLNGCSAASTVTGAWRSSASPASSRRSRAISRSSRTRSISGSSRRPGRRPSFSRPRDAGQQSAPCAVLVHDDPYSTFARALALFARPAPPATGIDALSAVAPDATIGADVAIGPFVTIGAGASIGARTIVYPNVVIGPGARIGEDCVIHSLACIRERVVLGAPRRAAERRGDRQRRLWLREAARRHARQDSAARRRRHRRRRRDRRELDD